MKLLTILSAAFLPLSLVAGFSQYLDVSALKDIPDECKQLSGSIAEYGVTQGSVWTPADVQANAETGIIELKVDSPVSYYPVSLDDYVRFGSYDDTASIEAFMNRGTFYKKDKYGEQYLAYTSDDISRIYTQMEDANYDTFEAICEEVEQNIQKAIEEARKNNDSNAVKKYTKAQNALEKFYNDGLDAFEKSADNTLAIVSAKARTALTQYEKDKAKHELLAAQNTASNIKSLAMSLKVLVSDIKTFRLRYMNDMNTIGAYLGSTNAMEYFSADMGKGITDEMTDRWFKFSNPEPIVGSPSYYNLFNIGGKNWYSVFHNFQSEYFLQALPFDAEDRLREHFNMPAMSVNNYRGFYEMPDDNLVKTNWYANKITAPKNWADGSSIIVTNGKFKVASSESDKYALKIIGTTASNYKLIGAPASKTNTVTFASASDSNVAVTIGGNNDAVTVTIGVYYK